MDVLQKSRQFWLQKALVYRFLKPHREDFIPQQEPYVIAYFFYIFKPFACLKNMIFLVILKTPFNESEYKVLDIYSSCFPIFLIIYIYSELETSFGGLMKFFPGYIGNGITIWFSKWKVPQRKRFYFHCI